VKPITTALKEINTEEFNKLVEKIVETQTVMPKGEVGSDYCQVCGNKTKYIGGRNHDIDEFQCEKCKAVHLVRVTYSKGKPISSILESII